LPICIVFVKSQVQITVESRESTKFWHFFNFFSGKVEYHLWLMLKVEREREKSLLQYI